MNTQEVLAHFANVHQTATGWMACCPAHDDHNPSLSISKGENGKTLLKCFAGCSLRDILSHANLTMKDIMGSDSTNHNTQKHSSEKMEIEARYVYETADGHEAFTVNRYRPKTFRICHKDVRGQTVWNLNGVLPVPYKLPQVVDAIHRQSPLFIVEGEKDVENMLRIGLTATCNPMGAGKWKDEYSNHFVGASNVTIISDKDTSANNWAGQRHALTIKESLAKKGVTANIIYSPTGKDISDFISSTAQAETAKNEILSIAENPPCWDAPWLSTCEPGNPYPRFGNAIPCDSKSAVPSYEGVIWLSDTENYTIRIEPSTKRLDALIRDARHEFLNNYSSKHKLDEQRHPSKSAYTEIEKLVIVMWLRQTGRFFWHAKTKATEDTFFLLNSKGRVLRIQSDEFCVWLSNSAHLDRSSRQFAGIMAFIQDAAMDEEVSTGVEPSAFVASRGNSIYISCGEDKIIKCSSGKVSCVPNGSDGILFPKESTLQEFKLLAENVTVRNPFQTLSQFTKMAYGNSHCKVLLEAWFLNIFACQRNHVPLLLTGERNSGKTHLGSALQMMAGFPPRNARIDPRKEEDFWVIANRPGLVLFDNLEEEVACAPWFTSALEKVTTGVGSETRKLYTHTTMQYSPSAHFILSSKIPVYAANDGIANRLTVISLRAEIQKYEDKALFNEICRFRDEAMTWVARTIAAALECNSQVSSNINKRYPDFCDFALKCGHVLGREDEFRRALIFGEIEKALIVIENDHDARMIYNFLKKKGDWEGNMLEIVESEYPGLDKKSKMSKSMSLGKTLSKLKRAFDTFFPGWSKRESKGCTLYHFPKMTDQS